MVTLFIKEKKEWKRNVKKSNLSPLWSERSVNGLPPSKPEVTDQAHVQIMRNQDTTRPPSWKNKCSL